MECSTVRLTALLCAAPLITPSSPSSQPFGRSLYLLPQRAGRVWLPCARGPLRQVRRLSYFELVAPIGSGWNSFWQSSVGPPPPGLSSARSMGSLAVWLLTWESHCCRGPLLSEPV